MTNQNKNKKSSILWQNFFDYIKKNYNVIDQDGNYIIIKEGTAVIILSLNASSLSVESQKKLNTSFDFETVNALNTITEMGCHAIKKIDNDVLVHSFTAVFPVKGSTTIEKLTFLKKDFSYCIAAIQEGNKVIADGHPCAFYENSLKLAMQSLI